MLHKRPRTLHCGMRSSGQSFSPYAFQCSQLSSLRKYGRTWTSAIYYFFRVWDQGRRLKGTTAHLCGIEFMVQQRADASCLVPLRALGIARRSSCFNIVAKRGHRGCHSADHLVLDRAPKNADLESTAIARFSGILGIHPHEYSFRRAYDYKPLLSALIWVGRLHFLSMPFPWRHMKLSPSAGRHETNIMTWCSVFATPYAPNLWSVAVWLLSNTSSSGANMVGRLPKREGPQTKIDWSKDDHELQIDKSSITVPQFRQVIHNVVAHT